MAVNKDNLLKHDSLQNKSALSNSHENLSAMKVDQHTNALVDSDQEIKDFSSNFIDNKKEIPISKNEIFFEQVKDENNKKEEIESDDHLPRVRIELDRLNYANESINNLELELEEAKREYIKTIYEADEELNVLEKKLGSCVIKSKPYYDYRIELNDAKAKYLSSKIRFETAQELYVAAKNMQMYAEENLENFEIKKLNSNNEKYIDNQSQTITNESKLNYDEETLIKMLEIAKIKVNDTELSKQSCDIEQIDALRVYDFNSKQLDLLEKDLKRSIEKSRKYYEQKAKFNKELKFLFSKVEGLKSCLKEAKLAYQTSLKNLEIISTEVHNQRNRLSTTITDLNNDILNVNDKKKNNTNDLSKTINKSYSPKSSSSLSSYSSSSISSPNLNDLKQMEHEENKTDIISTLTEETLVANSQLNDNEYKSLENEENEENEIVEAEEDFDKYFNEANQSKNEFDFNKCISKTIQYSQKVAKFGVSMLSDEEVDYLRLDKILKNYENELTNKKYDFSSSQNNLNSQRPQFRIPNLIRQSNLGFSKK